MTMPEKEMPSYARKFVDRAFERFKTEADKGCGLHYELYVQRFTDSVDALVQRTKRTDLREYIHSKAMKDDDYLPSEEGRWIYQHEENEMVFSPNNRVEEAKKSFDRLIERMESGPKTEEKPIHQALDRSIDR
jgi:hypothetical protein